MKAVAKTEPEGIAIRFVLVPSVLPHPFEGRA